LGTLLSKLRSFFAGHLLLRRLVPVATVALPLLVLGGLVYLNRGLFQGQQWRLRWQYVLASFVVFGLALLLAVWVWASIANSVANAIPFRKHFFYYCIANVAKRLPGTVWYVAGRGYLYSRDGLGLGTISVASGVELVVSVVAGSLTALLFGVPAVASGPNQPLFLGAVVIVGSAAVHPRVIAWALRTLKISADIQLRYSRVVSWVFAYVVIWALGGLVFYLVANSVLTVKLRHLPYIGGAWSLAGVLSSSLFFLPSNFGVTEVSLAVMMARLMPLSAAALVAVLVRIVLLLYEFVWALLCVLLYVKPRGGGYLRSLGSAVRHCAENDEQVERSD